MKVSPRRPRDRAEALLAQPSDWLPPAVVAGELAASLADAPLFAGMTGQEVAQVLASFDEARYPSGRRVLVEGLRGCDFFVIVAGTVAVAIDGWRLATLGPGDFFGEMAILGAGLRTASVRAETPLHCLVLPNGKLEGVLLDHPQLGINVLHALVSRFTNLTGRRQPAASELGN
jgi:CRP-like cAMP-binding protein